MSDRVLRAMTDDSMFRVIVAETTLTTRDVVSLQKAVLPTAAHLADLLTSAVLFRETMSPELRVQWILRGTDGKASIVADAHPSGATRGVVQLAAERSSTSLGSGASLQVMRTLQNGQISQGLIELDGAAGLAEAFMLYMHRSEQIESVVGIGSRFDGDRVVKAAGFVVQLLPDLNRAHLSIMLERLRDYTGLREQLADERFSPEWLLGELLWGMPFTQTGSSNVQAECWCSELRVMGALATLGRHELQELSTSSQVLEIDCEYCRKHYEISPARLRGLLDES